MHPKVSRLKQEIITDRPFRLSLFEFDWLRRDGETQRLRRTVYDHGGGATVLLHDPGRRTLLFTRQYRLAAELGGHPDGMLLETCAGMLDGDAPEVCARRETEEETGFEIEELSLAFDAYMSPGATTERVYFFIGRYDAARRRGGGGGLRGEEDIEIVELGFDEACALLDRGEIRDAKTLMLLQHARLRGLLA